MLPADTYYCIAKVIGDENSKIANTEILILAIQWMILNKVDIIIFSIDSIVIKNEIVYNEFLKILQIAQVEKVKIFVNGGSSRYSVGSHLIDNITTPFTLVEGNHKLRIDSKFKARFNRDKFVENYILNKLKDKTWVPKAMREFVIIVGSYNNLEHRISTITPKGMDVYAEGEGITSILSPNASTEFLSSTMVATSGSPCMILSDDETKNLKIIRLAQHKPASCFIATTIAAVHYLVNSDKRGEYIFKRENKPDFITFETRTGNGTNYLRRWCEVPLLPNWKSKQLLADMMNFESLQTFINGVVEKFSFLFFSIYKYDPILSSENLYSMLGKLYDNMTVVKIKPQP